MDLLSNLWIIIAPMVTGILFGFLFRGFQVIRTNSGALSLPDVETINSRLAQTCETLSLKVLLPTFVIESLLKFPIGKELLIAVIAGMFLPGICFSIANFLRKFCATRNFALEYPEAIKFTLSTFGGGNRGTIFIIALFGNSPDFSDYVKYFSLVDLGNFAFLILVIPTLLKKEYGHIPAKSASFLGSYLAVTFMFVAGFFIVKKILLASIGFDISIGISKTLGFRKTVLTFLLFAAITLRFKIEHKLVTRFLGEVLFFYSIRGFCGALAAAILVFSGLDPTGRILVCVITLLLMPPSSILPSMVAQARAPETTIDYINRTTATFNIVFLVFLGVVIAVKIIINS